VRGEDAVELVEVAGVVGDQGPRPHHRLVAVERRPGPVIGRQRPEEARQAPRVARLVQRVA